MDLQDVNMEMLLSIICAIVIIEGIFAIITVQILKKVDKQLREEPLIGTLTSLNIHNSVNNNDNYIIIKAIVFNEKCSIEGNFLIDSGANRSLLIPEILQKIGKFKKTINMTYGSGEVIKIKTYESSLSLNGKSYNIEFGELQQISDAFIGILGSDFLKCTKSYIDYKNHILICPDF